MKQCGRCCWLPRQHLSMPFLLLSWQTSILLRCPPLCGHELEGGWAPSSSPDLPRPSRRMHLEYSGGSCALPETVPSFWEPGVSYSSSNMCMSGCDLRNSANLLLCTMRAKTKTVDGKAKDKQTGPRRCHGAHELTTQNYPTFRPHHMTWWIRHASAG